MPYLIQGDLKLTESRAILNYIGNLKHLNGATPQLQAHHDMLLNVLGDFSRTLGFVAINRFDRLSLFDNPTETKTLSSIAYDADFAHLLVSVRAKDMPQVFTRLAAYLGAKHFLLGAAPSPADFVLYEQLVISQAMVADALVAFPTLEAFKQASGVCRRTSTSHCASGVDLQRVETLPPIAAYMRSERYLARPLCVRSSRRAFGSFAAHCRDARTATTRWPVRAVVSRFVGAALSVGSLLFCSAAFGAK